MTDERDWLDDEPFYNAMQRYRCAPREDQREVVACFEAVKRLVRAELAKPDAAPRQAPAKPLTDEQVFTSEDFMTANGLYLGLPMTTLIQIV